LEWSWWAGEKHGAVVWRFGKTGVTFYPVSPVDLELGTDHFDLGDPRADLEITITPQSTEMKKYLYFILLAMVVLIAGLLRSNVVPTDAKQERLEVSASIPAHPSVSSSHDAAESVKRTVPAHGPMFERSIPPLVIKTTLEQPAEQQYGGFRTGHETPEELEQIKRAKEEDALVAALIRSAAEDSPLPSGINPVALDQAALENATRVDRLAESGFDQRIVSLFEWGLQTVVTRRASKLELELPAEMDPRGLSRVLANLIVDPVSYDQLIELAPETPEQLFASELFRTAAENITTPPNPVVVTVAQ
jgi:hypothetical protein